MLAIRVTNLLPEMNECMESVTNVQINSTTDANSGFWRMKVDKPGCEKEATSQ